MFIGTAALSSARRRLGSVSPATPSEPTCKKFRRDTPSQVLPVEFPLNVIMSLSPILFG